MCNELCVRLTLGQVKFRVLSDTLNENPLIPFLVPGLNPRLVKSERWLRSCVPHYRYSTDELTLRKELPVVFDQCGLKPDEQPLRSYKQPRYR